MKALTSEEARIWCAQHDLRVSEDDYISFPDVESSFTLEFGKEIKEGYLIYLSRAIAACPDLSQFSGGLLWIRERGVWNDLDETAGENLFERTRGSSSISERPGTSFEGSEFVHAQSLLVPPIVVGWDAFFIPENAALFIFLCHDAYAFVAARTDRMRQTLLDYFKDWPPIDRDAYFNRSFPKPADHS